MTVFAYFTGTGAVYAWLVKKQGDYNKITYVDLVLPNKWSSIKGKIGQAKIERGLQSLEEKEYRIALMQLRSGLADYPQDNHARLQLARILASIKRHGLALEILERGFDYVTSEDEVYIGSFFQFAHHYSQYDRANAIAEKLKTFPEYQSTEKAKNLLEIQIQSLTQLEDYERLLTLIKNENREENELFFFRAEVHALIKLGRVNDALDLVDFYQEQGLQDFTIELLHLEALALENRLTQFHKHYAKLKQDYTETWKLRLKYIMLCKDLGLQEISSDEIDEFLWMFGHDFNVIKQVCAQLSSDGYSALIEKISELFKENHPQKQLNPVILVYLVQSYLIEAKWQDAHKMVQVWKTINTNPEAPETQLTKWAHLLTEHLMQKNTSALTQVKLLLRENRLPYQTYLQTAQALSVTNEFSESLGVIELGLAHYPFNLKITRLKGEIDQLQQDALKSRNDQIYSMLDKKKKLYQQSNLEADIEENMNKYLKNKKSTFSTSTDAIDTDKDYEPEFIILRKGSLVD